MAETFPTALTRVLKDRGLSAPDKAHIKRWLTDGYANNPNWARLAAAARVRGILPTTGLYEEIIREVLHIRKYAESVRSGIDPDLRERQRNHLRHLELAKKAEDLAAYFEWAEKYPGIADFYMRFSQPVGELQELHRKEAKLLRQRAGRVPTRVVRISRQDIRANRKGLRRLTAFFQLLNSYIFNCISDTTEYDAIALLAEIAFPRDDVDPEQVRKVLQPSTRSGRKSRRALAAKKS